LTGFLESDNPTSLIPVYELRVLQSLAGARLEDTRSQPLAGLSVNMTLQVEITLFGKLQAFLLVKHTLQLAGLPIE